MKCAHEAEADGARGRAAERAALPILMVVPLAAEEPQVLQWAKANLVAPASLYVVPGPLGEPVLDEPDYVLKVDRMRCVSKEQTKASWAGAHLRDARRDALADGPAEEDRARCDVLDVDVLE